MRSFSLRPSDSWIFPRKTLSIGFRVLVARHPAIQTTRRLTFASAGLSPAEHTRIDWTHHRICYPSEYRQLTVQGLSPCKTLSLVGCSPCFSELSDELVPRLCESGTGMMVAFGAFRPNRANWGVSTSPELVPSPTVLPEDSPCVVAVPRAVPCECERVCEPISVSTSISARDQFATTLLSEPMATGRSDPSFHSDN